MLMAVALTSTRKRLGVLTPSSNTVLEPVIVGLTARLPLADCERLTNHVHGSGARRLRRRRSDLSRDENPGKLSARDGHRAALPDATSSGRPNRLMGRLPTFQAFHSGLNVSL